MKKINKKLAYGLWFVCALGILQNILLFIQIQDVRIMVETIVATVFEILLGYTVYRDKNDRFTMMSILLIALFRFNIAGIVAIIMRLIVRKNHNAVTIRKFWFIPGVVAGVFMFIRICRYISFNNILSVVLSALFYLIFGYWFIKYLK